MNGYVVLNGSQRVEIHADTSYEAWRRGVEYFEVPPKQAHLVVVFLAEKNGRQVVHVADF